MLANGRLEAVISYQNVAFDIIKNLGLGSEIKMLAKPVLFKQQYYIGFNKNSVSKEFVDLFSTRLAALKKTEKYALLKEKYFPE